jgi:rhamnosyltransferase
MKPKHSISATDSKIAAIVVLYLPDEALLNRLLNSLRGTVGDIYIVDNTPVIKNTWVSLNWFVTKNHNVAYHPLGDNYGIAKAQNVGIELAIQSGCDHIALFDQDSAIPKGMINELLLIEQKLLGDSVNVGAVGPMFIDEKTGNGSNVFRHGRFLFNKIQVAPEEKSPINADYLISSGSLIRVSVLKVVGLMREDLFIDWVDIEWGLRAARLGFSNFAVPNVTMFHSIGDRFVKVGKRTINVHNDIRNYYIVRNACHLLLDSKIDNRWRVNILLKIPIWVIFYTVTSESKFKSFKRLLRACLDGFSGTLGRYSER